MRRLFPHAPKVLEPDAKAARAPQAELCGKDIKEFLGSTYEDIAFRGRMIVLPHASKGGHKSILRRGFHPRFTAKMARTVHAVIKSGSDYRPFVEGPMPSGRTPIRKGREGASATL